MGEECRYTSFRQFRRGYATVRFTSITPHKKEFLKRILKSGWGMDKPGEIKRIGTPWDSSSKNYQVSSEGQHYLLKESHLSDPRLRDLSNQFLSFCLAEGARVPYVHPTKRGWNYYGIKCIISLYDFIKGENFDGSREELREAAFHLAQLDKILARAPLSRSLANEGIKRTRHDPSRAKSLFELARRCGARNEAEEGFLSAIGYLEQKSAALSAINPGQLPMQPIHSNVQPHNLIFASDGVLLAFIDFESIVYSQRAREVALAMHRLSRAYGNETEKQHDIGADIRERARDFLSAYNAENPLEDSEMRSLKFFLEDESFRRALTVLKNHYLQRDYEKDGCFERKLTMLKETELFDFL